MQDLREVVEQFKQAAISHTSTKEKLEQELKNLQDQFEKKTRELHKIQAKLANSPKLRNIKRQVKRAKLTAEKRKTELKVKDDTIELQEKREMLTECDKKVEGMKTEKSKLQKRISYLNRKCSTKLE